MNGFYLCTCGASSRCHQYLAGIVVENIVTAVYAPIAGATTAAIRNMAGLACIINPTSRDCYTTPAKRPAYSVMSKAKIVHTFGLTLKPWQESLEKCISLLNVAGERCTLN